MSNSKTRLQLETSLAQAEFAQALAELRSSVRPAMAAVEKGSELAGAGLEQGRRLVDAVAQTSGTAGQGAAKLMSQVAGAALSSNTSGASKGAAVSAAVALAGWGLSRLKGGSTPEPAPTSALLSSALSAILPKSAQDLTDPDGSWLKEAEDLRKDANRQLDRIERALLRGKGDSDELMSHRDDIIATLNSALTKAFASGLSKLDTATRRQIIHKRSEDFAAHLAQVEADAGGGGLSGAVRRHPFVAGAGVLALGAAAAWFLPKGVVARGGVLAAGLAKDAAVQAILPGGALLKLAMGFFSSKEKASDEVADSPAETVAQMPMQPVTPPPRQAPMLLDTSPASQRPIV